ncbi:MAG: TatD family hydrolase [Clostridia bacterium]|nr:TatD family hydrolase [Clostridia bacterium]
MLFDTHAHYNDNRFKHDRYEAIEMAHNSGVSYILNVSYSIPSLNQSISLSKRFSYVYAAVGIHPHYASELNDELLNQIRSLAANKKVVALGEIGLDYYRNLSPQDVQKLWFAKQIALAKELDLPIIVHNRDAHEDVYSILKSEDAKTVGGVIHSYSGNVEMARKLLDNNFYISISGPVTYRNAKELADVVRFVPGDRLLIETDCPYLTPEPFRGKRNDSSLVRLVAERIAEIRGASLEEIARVTTDNAKRLFRIA